MTKIDKIIAEVKEGAWVGKLNYVDMGVISAKGLYYSAIEGGRYKVEDWDGLWMRGSKHRKCFQICRKKNRC